jgi:hypothetical protein
MFRNTLVHSGVCLKSLSKLSASGRTARSDRTFPTGPNPLQNFRRPNLIVPIPSKLCETALSCPEKETLLSIASSINSPGSLSLAISDSSQAIRHGRIKIAEADSSLTELEAHRSCYQARIPTSSLGSSIICEAVVCLREWREGIHRP